VIDFLVARGAFEPRAFNEAPQTHEVLEGTDRLRKPMGDTHPTCVRQRGLQLCERF
jgi:hypothetical protein